MNPWSQTPSSKKYPFGEVQRILYSSQSYNNFIQRVEIQDKESHLAKSTENKNEVIADNQGEDVDISNSLIQKDLIQSSIDLIKMNNDIAELLHYFDSIDLFTKYNQLVSQSGIENKLNIVKQLILVVQKILQTKIQTRTYTIQKEDKPIVDANDFITLDYKFKDCLLDLLKLVSSFKGSLDKNEQLSLRSFKDISELLIYLFQKQNKSTQILEELTIIHNNILKECNSIHELNHFQ